MIITLGLFEDLVWPITSNMPNEMLHNKIILIVGFIFIIKWSEFVISRNVKRIKNFKLVLSTRRFNSPMQQDYLS
jgi:hypothetical protein